MEALSITDYFSLFSDCAVIMGVLWGFHTWRKSMSIKRAEYVQSLREKFYGDKDIAEVMYKIEYNKSWYDGSFHGGSEIERKVDKLLSVCDHICYLYDNKLISDKEYEIFNYDLNRILNNKDVKAYLYNLHHWSTKTLDLKSSFNRLIQFGIRHHYFEDVFFDLSNSNYPHRLNF